MQTVSRVYLAFVFTVMSFTAQNTYAQIRIVQNYQSRLEILQDLYPQIQYWADQNQNEITFSLSHENVFYREVLEDIGCEPIPPKSSTPAGFVEFRGPTSILLARSNPEREKWDFRGIHTTFPNEYEPKVAQSFFDQAPDGTYVSVGTERGLISASLSPNVDRVLLIDRDPYVVRYNRINNALLVAADSRIEYLRLRLYSDRQAWLDAAQSIRATHPVLASILESKREFAFFRGEFTRTPQNKANFEDYHRAPGMIRDHTKEKFLDSNYLYEDALFARVKKLAVSDRIHIFQIQLGDALDLEFLIRWMKTNKIKLSVLDFSNAWVDRYLGPKLSAKVIEAFKAVAQPKSLYLATMYFSEMMNLGLGKMFVGKLWRYFGITFEKLDTLERLEEIYEPFVPEKKEPPKDGFFMEFQIDCHGAFGA